MLATNLAFTCTHQASIAPFLLCSVCFAKHVQDKAAKWARAKRPRKSRPSDKNRKPVVYELTSMQKPPEYDISDAPASPAPKPIKVASTEA
jgi:hypothetical protein